jgi:hypothetical protein
MCALAYSSCNFLSWKWDLQFKVIGTILANSKLVHIQEQKWIVAVISMVPIYATESVRF